MDATPTQECMLVRLGALLANMCLTMAYRPATIVLMAATCSNPCRTLGSAQRVGRLDDGSTLQQHTAATCAQKNPPTINTTCQARVLSLQFGLPRKPASLSVLPFRAQAATSPMTAPTRANADTELIGRRKRKAIQATFPARRERR